MPAAALPVMLGAAEQCLGVGEGVPAVRVLDMAVRGRDRAAKDLDTVARDPAGHGR